MPSGDHKTIKRKHKFNDGDEVKAKKKSSVFALEDFTKSLNTEHRLVVLKHFGDHCHEGEDDWILPFLEQGGTLILIMKTMENDPEIPHVLIFEIVNAVLLQISVHHQKYEKMGLESCKYLLNNFMTLINKMLGLSSITKERVLALKLLSTMVTFSSVLAKDVILHTNFYTANLELLSKTLPGENAVRNAFINFLVAFLVDNNLPTLAALLRKKGLLTSVVPGLIYDRADVVALIITAMKDHILRNGAISKTVKLKVFNTQIIKEIINLYNWKGPDGFRAVEQKIKTAPAPVSVEDKAKVNESVHGFLLTLCTSHQFGVIFSDHSLGSNRKKQNKLIASVLQYLEKPWQHSYASDLVIKICGACPDLTRAVWKMLQVVLEPRATAKWLLAMQFAEKLIEELQPERIEFCVNELNIQEVSVAVPGLVIPYTVLKTILPERQSDDKTIRFNIIKLLTKMCKAASLYLEKSREWPGIDPATFKTNISKYITSHFPDVRFILTNWNDEKESDLGSVSNVDYLLASFDLLEFYQFLAPDLLKNCSQVIDIENFLREIPQIDSKNAVVMREFEMKAIKFFLDLEPALFQPNSQIFAYILGVTLEFYTESPTKFALKIVGKLLENSGVFGGFEHEINLWINGVLNLKHFSGKITELLTAIICLAHKNLADAKTGLRSPLFGALTNYCTENDLSKHCKSYVEFIIFNLYHQQSDLTNNFVDEIKDFINPDLKEYMTNWERGLITLPPKFKYCLQPFNEFLTAFYANNFKDFLSTFDSANYYLDLNLNLFQTVIFQLSMLIRTKQIEAKHIENLNEFLDFLKSKGGITYQFLITVFENPVFLQNLTISEPLNPSTNLVLSLVKTINDPGSDYLKKFRSKIIKTVLKTMLKPKDQMVSIKLLETFKFDYVNCLEVLSKINDDTSIIFAPVIIYCLTQLADICKNDLDHQPPLDSQIINQLVNYFGRLITEQGSSLNSFCTTLLSYLKVFLHTTEQIDSKLFELLIKINDFNKDILVLCQFLLERRPDLLRVIERNLDEICAKKGFILSLLGTILSYDDKELDKKIFMGFEASILKALAKPQKAGQHFQNYYKDVGVLIETYLEPKGFANQVQKFEISEPFHLYLLMKVYEKIEKNNRSVCNMILTFTHLLNSVFKQKNQSVKLEESSLIFAEFLQSLMGQEPGLDLAPVGLSEAFKQFCKFSLKFGVDGPPVLLENLTKLIQFCVEDTEAQLILEMLLSHSLFLDVILGVTNRDSLLELWSTLCLKWPQFMDRSQIPILLSGYRATQNRGDKIILNLLKNFQMRAEQTSFYDFKPFLWGEAAASFYSVRSDLKKVLWRQPKFGDILTNLDDQTVETTINNSSSSTAYDLEFFLPLFSHLLAPENPVLIYKFTQSGALSMTVMGLAQSNKNLRIASCHVLARFQFHLEAKQNRKYNLMWLRFVEAVCRGAALQKDYKLNNFAAIFLARAALILTQPEHVMYLPISQYLSAKTVLDFSSIIELYTLLHSSDVNYKEHRLFLLEIINNGLKTNEDVRIFVKSMAFKLISELCSSCLSDSACKYQILQLFSAVCNIDLGIKLLCGNLAFLPQMFSFLIANLKGKDSSLLGIIGKLIEIFFKIAQDDGDRHRNLVIHQCLMVILQSPILNLLQDNQEMMFYQTMILIIERFPEHLLTASSKTDLILACSKDQFCNYLRQSGCKCVRHNDLITENKLDYYRRLLCYKILNK